MPEKLGLGTRENCGRKIRKLPGWWLSWETPEEELLGELNCIPVPKAWL